MVCYAGRQKYFEWNNNLILIVGKLDLSMAEKFHQALSHWKQSYENGAYSVDETSMVDELEGLFDEWISVEKDIQANKYSLSKMLV